MLNFFNIMDKEGVDVNKIQVVDIDSSFKLLALTKQKIVDAVPVDDIDYNLFLNAGAVVLPEWIKKGYVNKNVARVSVVVRTNFLDNNENVVGSFLDGLIQSLDFIENNQHESAELVATHINKASLGATEYKVSDIEKIWLKKDITYSAYGDPALLSSEADIAYKIGILEKKITLSDFYDFRFDKKLKEAEQKIYGKNN